MLKKDFLSLTDIFPIKNYMQKYFFCVIKTSIHFFCGRIK